MMRARTAASFAVLWTLQLLSLVSQVLCNGNFQLELGVFRNERGLNDNGNCCNGFRTDGMCSSSCRTFFRICLTHYMAEIEWDIKCTFGSKETPVLGDNTIDFSRSDLPDNFENPVNFPIDFSWPGSFSLIVEAWHDATLNGPRTGSARELIDRLATQHSSEVGLEWKRYNHTTPQSEVRLSYAYRWVCDTYYYGPTCMKLCRPRDDNFGHYTCTDTGEMVCMDGWTGEYCEQAICLPDCHKEHGFCDVPNECKCKMGYQGQYCDECITYPTCLHGTCNKPWECNCEDGWGGLFCNQDLNYCTHHTPCKNGGTCTNTGQGSYTCSCAAGFTGTNCEIEINDCERNPCENNGVCKDLGTGYECDCTEGFYGVRCQFTADSCETNPCNNGATCVEDEDWYKCVCAPGYQGTNCETEINECAENPCKNGGRCIDQLNGFRCVCDTAFRGPTCEENVDDCIQNPCLNNATCVDGLNDFTCRCVPGFVGALCQTNVDDCLFRPCANGGSCHDLVNDYRCTCATGFTGEMCEVNIDECASNPCRHGARCIDHVGDYTCKCQEDYFGKNCQFKEGETTPSQVVTTESETTQLPTTEVTEIEDPGESTNNTIVGGSGAHTAGESGIGVTQLLIIICVGTGVPLVLIIVLVAVCLCRKHRHRMTDNMEIERQNIQNNINNKCVDSAIFTTIPQSASNSSSIKNSNEEQDLNRKNSKHLLEKSNSRQFTKDLNTHDQSPTYLQKDFEYEKASRRLDLEASSPVDSSSISDYSPRDLEENIAKPSYSETNRNSILVLDPTHRQTMYHEEVLATEV